MLLTQKDPHQYPGNDWASITLAALLLGAPAQAQTPAGADWTTTTVAGTRDRGYSGDGGPAVEAAQGSVLGVAVDGAGNLYIADFDNYRIRRVNSTGTIATAGRTGQVQNWISDADLEQSLESMSPMQVDLLYRVCDSYLAEKGIGEREWPAAARICVSQFLPHMHNMTRLTRAIVYQRCHPGLLDPKVRVTDCILNSVRTADLRFGWDYKVNDREDGSPRSNAFDSVEEMQRTLAKQVDVFTYNGDNRRPPRTAAERRAIRTTGIVSCESVGSSTGTGGGQRNLGSGFVISTGDGFSIVLTAGHVIRDPIDDRMRVCHYLPHGRNPARVDANMAPRRTHLDERSDAWIRNDWGMLRVEGELPWTIPLTQRGKDEIFRLLSSRSAYLKLYARHPNPPQPGGPQIQVSDNCELLRPVGRGDLSGGSPHILYHTCDMVSTTSGGLLALELADGTTEAIGINRAAANTAAYEPLPDERNEAIPRSNRAINIALSLASDNSMPVQLRRVLP